MIYLSIDIETSGLDHNKAQVLEFAAVLEDTSKNIPLANLPFFHAIFSYTRIEGDPVALKMNSELIAKIARGEGMSWADACISFGKFLYNNGFIVNKQGLYTINVAGKNYNKFDDRFLQNTPFLHLFKAHSRTLDPAILYAVPTDDKLPSLEECKRRAGLEPKVAHTALADALDVIELIRLSEVFKEDGH